MTRQEFNTKYKKYTQPGFDKRGPLEFDIEAVTNMLDEIFDGALIHIPEFQVAQIKLKWDYACFYSNLPHALNAAIERQINATIKRVNEEKK